MLKVQEYLRSGKSFEDLYKEYGIVSKVYDDRVVLNYRITSDKKYDQITRECRGLILTLPNLEVCCRSFDRFFNYGEGEEWKEIDWENCIYFDKLDGSLINIYYHPNTGWNVATRGTAFAEATTPMGKSFSLLVSEAINHVDFQEFCSNLNKNCTFIFELTSPENRIVTRYNETKLTLLAIRNNISGKYVSYEIIKDVINEIFPEEANVKLVESFDLKNAEDALKFVESRGELDEGLVCYDTTTQKRVKIKNSSYVAIHHLRGNEVTLKSIVTLLLKGEESEYLSYFPEDKNMLQPYIDKYTNLKNDVLSTYETYKHIENQKEFALKVKDLPYASMLFSLRKGMTVENIFSVDRLNTFIKFFE